MSNIVSSLSKMWDKVLNLKKGDRKKGDRLLLRDNLNTKEKNQGSSNPEFKF